MRLFVGLPLPELPRQLLSEAASSWRQLAPELKWVDPALYHLTLQFLGEVSGEKAAALEDALAALSNRPAFVLRLGAVMTLPPGHRARVLALSLADGFNELRELAQAVMAVTEKLGFPPESRPFRAHLTLARARRGERLPAALDPAGLSASELPAWEVAAFHLMKSVLRPGGPIYSSLARIELDAGGSG